MARNAFYAQSGGVTAVINASAAGVIETARKHRKHIGKVYAGKNGILGALHEELIDTSKESAAAIRALKHTPGGAFGSARYKLKKFDQDPREYERLIEVFRAHDIGYFFFNGGNDSADTCLKVSQLAGRLGYPLTAVHVPKTVDNDLPITDCCPGFGSVAKYVAVSMMEAGMDVESMARTSTKVFILEVMGRHAGWITAATALAQTVPGTAPHVLLFPEIAFDEEAFLARVKATVDRYGYCAIGVSEGLHDRDGKFLAESGLKDAVRPQPAGRRRPAHRRAGARQARPQAPLGRRRLPAALGAAHRLEGRPRAVLRRRQGRGRVRGEGHEQRHAHDRAHLEQAVSLEDRRGAVEGRRQRREEDAARLHHAGRLPHHAEVPQLSCPAHRG
jgi:6-phosphofructokinase